MNKVVTMATLLCASLTAQAQPVNQVLQWNKTLLTIVRTAGAQPATVHPTRSFAIMHAAIYDAVNTIDGTHAPYLIRLTGISPEASQDAAASAAAHEVLVTLYPAFKVALDMQFQQSLTQISGGDKAAGVTVGQTVADNILALRSNDGSNATPPPFVFENVPGRYQSPAPNPPTAQPQFTHWSHVTPFALREANQFRPGPPPSLGSDRYADVFNEVKAFGIVNSTAASADQALTGRFWNGAIQNYWNEIAQTASQNRNLTTAQNARLFAALNLALADSVIAFYDAKYVYNFWRPVTAIRGADLAENLATLPDPNWLPEVGKTTPDPAYPGAHAVISAAGATVLNSFFRGHRFEFSVISEVMPGTVRSFKNFSAAEEEATLSRIFAGVHFRSDLTSGNQLGREVAHFVVDNFLTPLHRNDESEDDN
jgi:hypothetical protein